MPHSIAGYQPYELMFGHKAPTVHDTWLWLAHYNDQASTSKCAWLNEQHKLCKGTDWLMGILVSGVLLLLTTQILPL